MDTIYINIKLYIKGIATELYVNSERQWYLDFDFNKALQDDVVDDLEYFYDWCDDLCQCLESRMGIQFDRFDDKYDIIDVDVDVY